jgi:hypothetical protein
MSTIVLRDGESKDVGFLLIAGSEPISAAGTRDVIFMASLLPSPSTLGTFVRDHKHVEFACNVSQSHLGHELSFRVIPGVSFRMHIEGSGAGNWSIGSLGSGSCQLLPA